MTQGHLKTQICMKSCSKRADCSFYLFRSVPIFVTDYTVPFLWPPPKRGGGAGMLWDRDGSHLHTNATTTGHVSTPKHPWWVIVNDVTIYTEFYLIKLDINQFKSKFRKVQQFGTRLTKNHNYLKVWTIIGLIYRVSMKWRWEVWNKNTDFLSTLTKLILKIEKNWLQSSLKKKRKLFFRFFAICWFSLRGKNTQSLDT